MNNNKIEDFKLFVKANPFLISYIRDKRKTWQELYELYDMVGDDTESWNKYLETNNSNNKTNTGLHFDDIVKMAKNIDVDKVQESITSLQKTLTLFSDLFVGSSSGTTNNYNPRPLYRRFDD